MEDQTNSQLQRRPEGVACTPCRRAKMRCVVSNPVSAACDRCDRLGKQCVYETHRRGQWRRDITGKREDLQNATDVNVPEPDLLSNTQRLGFENQGSGSNSAPSGSDQSPFTPGTLRAALDAETTFGTESSSQFDLFMRTFDQKTNLTKNHDPIEMGLISRPSAQILFEGIFQPQSHRTIRDHSEALLGRALLQCDSAIENIWAIICMYHWKDKNDKRGAILIGFASQMAAYAEWNVMHHDTPGGGQTLDSSELQSRQERDRKRVLVILQNTERIYRLGDCTSIKSHEMTHIARDVYESMKKFGEHHNSYPTTVADFERFQNVMTSFHSQINEWRDQWCTVYSNFPYLEPLQRPITLLHRDYMCLYFNTIHLHMLLESDDRPLLGDQIAQAACICFSSAFGILQHAVHFGEMNVIYYLWDNAHNMVAYAAMLIPKLLEQGIDEPTMLKQQAVSVLDQANTTYLIASRSMVSQESHTPDYQSENECHLSTQARLLSTILGIINSSTPFVDESPEARGLSNISFNPDLPWLEEDQTSFNFFSEDRTNHLESPNINIGSNTFAPSDYFNSRVPQEYEELSLLEDKGFLESMYLNAGLLPLQKSGILSRDL
ncbi:unnamed protein product [Fusarium graminearum]|uniref:Zn(2)-C6 fungal-type domain-containing protein n=1 Tax=Gibberella zeae TaxID=5518 RepID=A0A9N8NI47_GIBZA|nr:unnamed protein product [Fusarium graminearum]CAG1982613.1 unnamed protein product [Fusarium graminearum]